MHQQGLVKVLLGKVKIPEKKKGEGEEARERRMAEEQELVDKQYDVWCELVQCLDSKSINFISCFKPNGSAAWEALVKQFKSNELPRVHSLINLNDLNDH